MKGPTQGQKKLQLQFERLTETDSFKDEVVRVRKALGFRVGDSVEFSKEMRERYGQETATLRTKLPILNDYILTQLRDHILQGKPFNSNLGDVCEIEDAQSELERYALNEDPDSSGKSPINHNEVIEEKLSRYPVSVRIHIAASQRDVVEFIKKNWDVIHSNQKAFTGEKQSSLKNSKTGVVHKKRDAFIYEHRDMSRKQLAKLVRENFKGESLDGNDVGKIISLEESRRKV